MRKLLVYTVGGGAGLDDTSPSSNMWYIRRYEEYFDHVYVVHLRCAPGQRITNGRTTVIPLGGGNAKLDLLVSPWRLLKIAEQLEPTHYLVSDLVWSWWLSSLIRMFRNARIHLLPLVIPEVIYRSTNKSISGRLPIWVERICLSLSYLFADRIVVGKGLGDVATWFSSNSFAAPKLFLAESLVESLPPPPFFERLTELEQRLARSQPEGCEAEVDYLLYVGRLNPEKMVDHVIKMFAEMVQSTAKDRNLRLKLIGGGSERAALEKLADKLKVRELIDFVGYVSNSDLPVHYLGAAAFVSPLTGLSLREAAFCGTPVIAYDMDWVHGLLQHEHTALLVKRGDYREMAHQGLRLSKDIELRKTLSHNIKELAWRLWSPERLRESLKEMFASE